MELSLEQVRQAVVMLIALVLSVAVLMIGSRQQLFTRHTRYNSSFRNVNGLAVGAPANSGSTQIQGSVYVYQGTTSHIPGPDADPDLTLQSSAAATAPLIIDIREPGEFEAMHIGGSLNVPRGILESACEWDYEETEPELVRARGREIVVVCRSGNRTQVVADFLARQIPNRIVSIEGGIRKPMVPAPASDPAQDTGFARVGGDDVGTNPLQVARQFPQRSQILGRTNRPGHVLEGELVGLGAAVHLVDHLRQDRAQPPEVALPHPGDDRDDPGQRRHRPRRHGSLRPPRRPRRHRLRRLGLLRRGRL